MAGGNSSIPGFSSNAFGNVIGPTTSTDNAIVRFDGTTGAIQNSSALLADDGSITATSFTSNGGTNVFNSGNFLPLDVTRGTASSSVMEFKKTGFTNKGSIYIYSVIQGTQVGFTNNLIVDDSGNTTRPDTGKNAWALTLDNRGSTNRIGFVYTSVTDVVTTPMYIDGNASQIQFSWELSMNDFGTQHTALDVIAGSVLRMGNQFSTVYLSPTGGAAITEGVRVNTTFNPTSGSGEFITVKATPTINQTSTASGEISVFDANPTMTSVKGSIYGFRSRLTAGPTGGGTAWNIYADGTANNYFANNILIGGTTADASIQKGITVYNGTAPGGSVANAFQIYGASARAKIYEDADRFIVQAAASTKTTAGAPYANDGYVSVVINGSTLKIMTTA